MELNAEQIRYKMSEKQIKTALECLSKPNSSPADREKCYFMWKEPSCLSCYHEVAQNALAIITSQEQRIKELAEEVESLKQAMEHEHASFMETFGEYGEKCDKLTEENERLRAENEIKSQKRANIFEITNAFERGRADGVRKMHSMLCEGRVSNDTVVIVANQIAKEMLQEG